MSVTVQNVTKFYGKQKALNDISFTLKKGEICGFLGPNGAGKSTMMKIITGYLERYQGEVKICETDIRQQPLKTRALIGYLPEHNPLYPDMYIKEYLSHVATLYHMPNAALRVAEIMELTGLITEYTKKIGQLSKGYRQRVGLAQALVHDPEVLILDEPMTGLDPNQLEDIRNLIIRIGHDKTVMLSTHIMQEVEAICDRVIIINQGNIVANKLKEELHSTGDGHMLIDICFAGNNPQEWLEKLDHIDSIMKLESNSYRIISAIGTDPRIAIFHAAAANECPIIELKVEERSLEDTFKQLTK